MNVQLQCGWCQTAFEKYEAEVRRQRKAGRKKFFCSLSCGAKWNNKDRVSKPVLLVCEWCGEKFWSTSGSKSAKRFCSKSCASQGKVTECQRRKAAETGRKNILAAHAPRAMQKAMQTREGWKYKNLGRWLTKKGEPHEFEYPLPGTPLLFDLALLERKTLVEFDGPEHSGPKAAARDQSKDRQAEKHGWKVIRIRVLPQAKIRVVDFKRHVKL